MQPITVETTVRVPVGRAWEFWTKPEHLVHWTFASDEWHVPKAENDLREGGRFMTRMEAKDGSAGFDFSGVYTRVTRQERIEYAMDDGRTVQVVFEHLGESGTKITQTFDPESENPANVQREGWQSILENFKSYAESRYQLAQ